MNKSLVWISLVVAFALVSTARAEFEETNKQSVRVVRPTIVCTESGYAMNEKLKTLEDGSYKLVHFGVAANTSGIKVCAVVEPVK